MRAHGQQVSGLPTSYRIICKTVICSVDLSALSNTTSRCCLAGFSVHASLIWYLPLPIQYGSALLLCSGLSVQASLVWNNLPPVQYGSALPSVEDFSEAQYLFPSFNVCHFSTGAHKICNKNLYSNNFNPLKFKLESTQTPADLLEEGRKLDVLPQAILR